jgi:exonuclease SbcD
MNLVLIGDVHLRSTVPARRVDDFLNTQYNKLREVFEAANDLAAPVICTGDVFDKHDPPHSLVNRYMPLFRLLQHGFYTCVGNHDIFGANLATVDRSALGVLANAGVVTLLSALPVTIGAGDDTVVLSGSTYMDNDVHPDPTIGSGFKLLVSHEMVLMNKLYREQEDFIHAEAYAQTHSGWDLVLCGHYHYHFTYEGYGTRIINPGALVRIKASLGDMKLIPRYVVLNTQTKALREVLLKVRPATEVFNNKIPSPAALAKEKSEKLEAFVEQLAKNEHMVTEDFSDVLIRVLEQENCSERVKDLVKSIVAQAQGMK